jgi:hypothetical protein
MTTAKKVENRSRAYWCGWFDGRYGSTVCFTENPPAGRVGYGIGEAGLLQGSSRRPRSP